MYLIWCLIRNGRLFLSGVYLDVDLRIGTKKTCLEKSLEYVLKIYYNSSCNSQHEHRRIFTLTINEIIIWASKKQLQARFEYATHLAVLASFISDDYWVQRIFFRLRPTYLIHKFIHGLYLWVWFTQTFPSFPFFIPDIHNQPYLFWFHSHSGTNQHSHLLGWLQYHLHMSCSVKCITYKGAACNADMPENYTSMMHLKMNYGTRKEL